VQRQAYDHQWSSQMRDTNSTFMRGPYE